jgi:hypothetical protein
MTRPELFKAFAELAPGRLPWDVIPPYNDELDFCGSDWVAYWIKPDTHDTDPDAALFIVWGLAFLHQHTDLLLELDKDCKRWWLGTGEGVSYRVHGSESLLDAVLEALVAVLTAMKEQEG